MLRLAQRVGRLADDGVASEFLPARQVIIAARHTLRLYAVVVIDAGVEGDGRAIVIDDGAGPNAAAIGRVRRRRDGDRQLLPMHEVVADGVAPMHIGVVGAIGIVLEE